MVSRMRREHPAWRVPQLRRRARPATDSASGPTRSGPAVDPSRAEPRLRRDVVALTSRVRVAVIVTALTHAQPEVTAFDEHGQRRVPLSPVHLRVDQG